MYSVAVICIHTIRCLHIMNEWPECYASLEQREWLPDIVFESCSGDFLLAPKVLVQYKLGIELSACRLLQQEGPM